MQRYLKPLSVFFIAAAVTVIIFALLYRYDNKYTYPGPMGSNGVLLLNGDDQFLVYPIDGWEFYRNRLLSPDDFTALTLTPDTYLYIGQYSGFGLDDPQEDPFGTATYRLHVFTGCTQEKTYMLELPEIFSAYRLFINGRHLVTEGTPASDGSYQAHIFHSSITFQAADHIEIIFQTANYDHYYSGLVYPPLFGTAPAVQKLMNTQMLMGSMRFFMAVTIGVFYFWTGLSVQDRKNTLWFGLLCLLYAGSISYVMVHFLGLGNVGLWYRLEDFCFYGTMLCITLICTTLYQKKDVPLRENKIALAILFLGGTVCLSSFIFPTLIDLGLSGLVFFYSRLVDFYKIAVTCYLFYSAFQSVKSNYAYAGALFAAAGIYTISLGTDALVPLYEPIRFGWPTEIGGFVFILILGALITLDTVRNFRERQHLALQKDYMETQLFLQQEHYQKLSDQIAQTRKDRHDLQHHLRVLRNHCIDGNLDRLAAYLDGLTDYSALPGDVPLCENFAVSSLVSYYAAIAGKEQIEVTTAIRLPETVGDISNQDLCIITGNLLENAIEANLHCDREHRFLSVHMHFTGNYLAILVDNHFDGNCQFREDRFYSRKRNYRTEGIGISSVKAIADKYMGQASFQMKDKVFEASILLKYCL